MDERREPPDRKTRSHVENFQCELSIITATKLNDFIEQSKLNRQECELRYANDRKEAKEFRELVLKKIDYLTNVLGGIVPSVELGRKISWGIVATVGVTVLSGIAVGVWKTLRVMVKFFNL